MNHEHHGHVSHSVDSIGVPTVNVPVNSHGMQHAMTFHFGTMEAILFNFWMPDSAIGMFGSCVIVVLMCALMESIRFFRSYKSAQRISAQLVAPEDRTRLSPRLTASVVVDAVFHLLQLTLAYLLMLIFMTFNVWLCIAVLLGEVLSRLVYAILFPNMDAAADGNACG